MESVTEEDIARMLLSRFSQTNPLIVPRCVYQQMSKRDRFVDLMDRMRIREPLPLGMK